MKIVLEIPLPLWCSTLAYTISSTFFGLAIELFSFPALLSCIGSANALPAEIFCRLGATGNKREAGGDDEITPLRGGLGISF